MNELHLFAGAGGGILAGQLLGHRTICAVEWEPYAQAVLVARQNDGTFPPFPVWDDVQTFDGHPWRGLVGIVAGGFPCQDISTAGKGAGLDGARSGMWHHMARIIGEVRPRFVLVENSPALTSRGLGRVLGDLAALGFDAQWGVLGACDVGAPHKRERIWIVANARSRRLGEPGEGQVEQPRRTEAVGTGDVSDTAGQQPYGCGTWAEQEGITEFADGGGDVANASGNHEQRQQPGSAHQKERTGPEQRQAGPCSDGFGRWPAEPGLGRVVNGMAYRSHRLKAIGNGQVSRVAATAFNLLKP